MQNNEYWQQRFVLLEETQTKNAKDYLNTLKEEYEKSLLQIEKDITNWYTRLADNNEINYANAKKLLDKKELKEFRWTVEEYIKKGKENAINQNWMKELENASARVHIDELETIKLQIQNELEQLYGKQDKGITNLAKQQYQNSYYKSTYEIQKGLDEYERIQAIDITKAEKIISKPWTTDGKTFSDRIWNNKNELTKTLQTELAQATIRGERLDKVINTISKKFDVAKNKAGRLVMTESAFFSSIGQKDCFNSLGVEKYEIVATLDTHTSEICQELDGKVFAMKDYQVGVTAPPFHVNCRSVTVPYFDDEFTQGEKRAYRDEKGKTKYIDSKIKYKDWKQKYVDNEVKTSTNKTKDDKIINKLGNSSKNSIGGTGKGIFIEKIDTKDINKKLSEYEEEIRNKPIEYGVLIDEIGNVYAYTGDETNLAITDKSLEDTILTHNHPEIASFGKDDFELLKQNPKIKELRAVDKEYTYSLKILKELDITYNEFYGSGLDLKLKTGSDLQHCIMKKIAERGYVKYDRRRN
ncbi:MAG: minor capsid protein [Clostridia bacterium]|nr:minor capsid protein [Clostridia bacterium]